MAAQGGSLTVHVQLQRLSPERGGDANGWARTETKAARKSQTVPLTPETAAALDAHRRKQAAERTPDWRYWGLVFVTPEGEPLHGPYVRHQWKLACLKAKIRPRRFHDMRHTSARLMKDLAVPEDVRMAMLGHSTEAVSRAYGGASEDAMRDAAERLGRALGDVG